MTCNNLLILCLAIALVNSTAAFTIGASTDSIHRPESPTRLQGTRDGHGEGRRSFLTSAAAAGLVAPFSPASVEPAAASGGATAGGAYLLSAKQRYNERVKASVQGFLALEGSLKNGDSKPAKAYFESEDGGSWKDLTAAGYLLSNAFRRNSTAAPDSLPAVKV